MLDAIEYQAANNDIPKLGDTIAPWLYRGWLLPYVVGIHEHVIHRWPYYLATLEAGCFLESPIPQVRFSEPDKSVFRKLQEWCEIIGYDHGGWSDFTTLIEWFLYALRLSDEYPRRISDDKQEQLYRTVNVGPMLQKPYDYLGTIVSEHKANGWNPTAFYPTPHAVCECMAQMTLHDLDPNKTGKLADGRDLRAASVCDPCIGSGQDVDYLAVSMTKINGALYVPWLSFPLPKAIVNEAKPIQVEGIII